MFTTNEEIFYIFICICGVLSCIKLCCNVIKEPRNKIIRIDNPPSYEDNNVPLLFPPYEENDAPPYEAPPYKDIP